MRTLLIILTVILVISCNKQKSSINTNNEVLGFQSRFAIKESEKERESHTKVGDTILLERRDGKTFKADKHVSSRQLFEADNFLVPKQIFTVHPDKDTIVMIGKEGTCILIPKDAFVDVNGQGITEEVKITFKEYRNSAQIAFSNLPMVFRKDGEEFNFNSSGMFSIKGHVQEN